MRDMGQDPFREINRQDREGTPGCAADKRRSEAAGVIQSAIESFAQELAVIIRRFLKLKEWKDAERLLIGGGFSRSRIGELAIGRASVLLKIDKVEICIIRNDPDEAGLIEVIQMGAFARGSIPRASRPQ
jgi:hypothetical protein